MMTTVTNLSTGAEAIYSLPPAEAVRSAYALFGRADRNTWDYEAKYPICAARYGKHVVSYGDWTARIA